MTFFVKLIWRLQKSSNWSPKGKYFQSEYDGPNMIEYLNGMFSFEQKFGEKMASSKC